MAVCDACNRNGDRAAAPSLVAGDADLGLPVEVVHIEGLIIRAKGIGLHPRLHALQVLLVLPLDLLHALPSHRQTIVASRKTVVTGFVWPC